MSLKYKLSARTSPKDSDAEAKIYAGAVNSGTLSMEEICANVERNSTATRGDVKGIALAFSNYLIKSLTAGNSVYLEDLGFFRVGCSSNGAETEDTFTPSHITRKYINFQPKGQLSDVKSRITFEKVGKSADVVVEP